jgi:hypothetical protein
MEYDKDGGDEMILALFYLANSHDQYSATNANQRGAQHV